MENDISAGYPKPPCKPTSPRGSTLVNQHSSIGFRAYLTMIFLDAFIHRFSCKLYPGVFLHPQPQLQTSAINTTFFSSLNSCRDTSHTHTHTSTMPRQRSAGRAPSRPTVPSRAPAAPTSQQQTRPATSYAAPNQAPHQPAPQAPASQGPGLFGQMASTAAYVWPLISHCRIIKHNRRPARVMRP